MIFTFHSSSWNNVIKQKEVEWLKKRKTLSGRLSSSNWTAMSFIRSTVFRISWKNPRKISDEQWETVKKRGRVGVSYGDDRLRVGAEGGSGVLHSCSDATAAMWSWRHSPGDGGNFGGRKLNNSSSREHSVSSRLWPLHLFIYLFSECEKAIYQVCSILFQYH